MEVVAVTATRASRPAYDFLFFSVLISYISCIKDGGALDINGLRFLSFSEHLHTSTTYLRILRYLALLRLPPAKSHAHPPL